MKIIAKGLERLLGKDKFERLRDSSAYKYAVDTVAMISFSTPIAMINEITVAGMGVIDSLKARGIATCVNLATARPYGKYRDWIFKKTKTDEKSGFFRKFFTDILAFATFQAPLYAGIISVSGADAEGVAKGTATITALSGIIGRPYGAYMDWLREQCGITPEYRLNKDGLLDPRNVE